MNRMPQNVFRFAAVGLMLLLSAVCAFADGDFSGAIGGVRSLYRSVGSLLQVVMGLAGLVVLTMIVIRIMRGDKEAAAKLGWWLLGLAFGFIMISVLTAFGETMSISYK